MSVMVTVKITDECEGLITYMPRGYEYELIADEGDGVVGFMVHDVDELTSGMEQALDTNGEVISYMTE